MERAHLQPGGAGVHPGGMVTGIGIAAPMISAARRRVRDPEIEWIVGDAETYPLAVAVDIACEVLLVQ
jgi:ubiquinone/menaquinone biosynthesis C-methylase UbiE